MKRDMNAVKREEMEVAREWERAHFEGGELPFSFRYGGRAFGEIRSGWRAETSKRTLDGGRTERTMTWTDGETGLEVKCVRVTYGDFPVMEWTIHFENTGGADTPIIEDIQGLDTAFNRPDVGEFTLHHWVGSIASAQDMEPRQTKMEPQTLMLATRGGYPSDLTMPYFNLEWSGRGVIVAVGWPGQWASEWAREGRTATKVRAGQEGTHFRLHAGEKVRGPLIALLFYEGGFVRSQNVWRRWMIAHNLPRFGGDLPRPFMPAGSSGQFSEMEKANEANQIEFIDRYLAKGVPIDLWWMDAGWYDTPDLWWKTGTWKVDPRRFPRGLKPITDHAHERGLKALAWFEPERVYEGTELWEKHPEWLLKWEGRPEIRILNLGIPEALKWIVERVDRILREEGIDVYRQDFNVFILPWWRANDEPEREGITEIKHVEGYLAYWDELRRRHPGMLLDTCASGGRRLDLETLRRSVPLHKTDHDYSDWEDRQRQFYGAAFWLPYFGASVCRGDVVEPYSFRSGYAQMTGIGFDVRREDFDYKLMRKLAAEWRRVSEFYYGDYYPLTSYTSDLMSWLAWQFDRPEKGDGLVQVFRRSQSPYPSAQLRLHNLDPEATYEIEDFDRKGARRMSGKALMERGLSVELPKMASSAIFTYRKRTSAEGGKSAKGAKSVKGAKGKKAAGK